MAGGAVSAEVDGQGKAEGLRGGVVCVCVRDFGEDGNSGWLVEEARIREGDGGGKWGPSEEVYCRWMEELAGVT